MGDVLSPVEIAVLQALCDGLTPAQIAAKRFVSSETVKSHCRHIYRKLGLRWTGGGTQVRAVVLGLQLGLIQLPSLEG